MDGDSAQMSNAPGKQKLPGGKPVCGPEMSIRRRYSEQKKIQNPVGGGLKA